MSPETVARKPYTSDMSLFDRIGRWRARRRQAMLDQYATLSAEERAEVDELRDEHNAGRGMSFGARNMADREMKWPDR
jgi:hypothetical protein